MRQPTKPQIVTSLVIATAIGVLAGIGGFTFVYAKGGSDLTDDPAACVNCHIMREQFARTCTAPLPAAWLSRWNDSGKGSSTSRDWPGPQRQGWTSLESWTRSCGHDFGLSARQPSAVGRATSSSRGGQRGPMHPASSASVSD